MGLCSSSNSEVVETKDNRPSKNTGGAGMLSGLALKFPHISKSFKNVKGVFDANTDGKDVVSAAKLKQMMNSIGAVGITDEEVEKLFKVADLDGSRSISFREWLIMVGCGYYLDDKYLASESKDPQFAETRKGFKVVREAFDKIDADHGGSVDSTELKQALFETASSQESKDILEARFKELDFDGDGDIYFPEFMYGIVQWVGHGMDDEDDEEEEKQN